MDAVFEKLRKQCLVKPTKSFKDLEVGCHEVFAIKNCKTIHGRKICIEFEEFVMFTPERVRMSNDELEILQEYVQEGKGRLFLNYIGKNGDKPTGMVCLDFERMDFDPLYDDMVSPPPPPPTPTPVRSAPSIQYRKK